MTSGKKDPSYSKMGVRVRLAGDGTANWQFRSRGRRSQLPGTPIWPGHSRTERV